MLPIGTEWTNISGRVMYQPMPNHLVFAFESPSSFASRAALYRAIMGAGGRVDIGVRVEKVLRLKRCRHATGESTHIVTGWIVESINTHTLCHRCCGCRAIGTRSSCGGPEGGVDSSVGARAIRRWRPRMVYKVKGARPDGVRRRQIISRVGIIWRDWGRCTQAEPANIRGGRSRELAMPRQILVRRGERVSS